MQSVSPIIENNNKNKKISPWKIYLYETWGMVKIISLEKTPEVNGPVKNIFVKEDSIKRSE